MFLTYFSFSVLAVEGYRLLSNDDVPPTMIKELADNAFRRVLLKNGGGKKNEKKGQFENGAKNDS